MSSLNDSVDHIHVQDLQQQQCMALTTYRAISVKKIESFTNLLLLFVRKTLGTVPVSISLDSRSLSETLLHKSIISSNSSRTMNTEGIMVHTVPKLPQPEKPIQERPEKPNLGFQESWHLKAA
jgi:hypothetical protein